MREAQRSGEAKPTEKSTQSRLFRFPCVRRIISALVDARKESIQRHEYGRLKTRVKLTSDSQHATLEGPLDFRSDFAAP